MRVGGEAWRAASFTRRYSVGKAVTESDLRGGVIAMEEIKCSKCEHYHYDERSGDEYCSVQLSWEELSAYADDETDELPKLVRRTNCDDYRSAWRDPRWRGVR